MTEKELKLEAIELVSTLASTAPTELEQARILKWRTQSARHENAWVEAEQAWGLMAELVPEDNITLATETKPTSVNVPLSQTLPQSQWHLYRVPAAIAASLTLMLVFLFSAPATTNITTSIVAIEQVEVEEYRNQRREQYSVTLADGSIVHLNYNSSIQVSFAANSRNIELLQGEAFFEVAKNPDRPFIVQAGATTATAVGTAFLVRRQGNDVTQITVTEGLVAVGQVQTQSEDPLLDSITLSVNQSITASDQSLSAVETVDADNTAAWHRGVLVFRDTSLSDALAEISRYTPYRIETDFTNWPSQAVTGTFFLNRLDDDLSTLISNFNLVVINNRNGVLELGLPRPQRPGVL